MAVDRLRGIKNRYDTIIIGSGISGLTAANMLARRGYAVLVLEHHYQYGGLATWFRRKHKHIFDISLHGFPYGMVKSCRKYWTKEIADSIRKIESLRFKNPDFDITTSFDGEDFVRILIEQFGVESSVVKSFFERVTNVNFYDEGEKTTRELFEEFFPGRSDVHRFLLEPIAYANGSTLEDPALTYCIVFSNFMNKGVYIFQGGADVFIGKLVAELERQGVDLRKFCEVEQVLFEDAQEGRRACGVRVNGREIYADAVISNANLKGTVFNLVDKQEVPEDFYEEVNRVRLNSTSCQVYMGIKEGESIPNIGDLVFISKASPFSSDELKSFDTTSRTFSMYYPDTRPQNEVDRYAVVASLNANWADWANLSEEDYVAAKERLCRESLEALEELIPGVSEKVNWIEAATPRTVNRFTKHVEGATFGTKYEGLAVSAKLPEVLKGLYHSGSVGIIMSGWLGTMNYGVINANRVDQYLSAKKELSNV